MGQEGNTNLVPTVGRDLCSAFDMHGLENPLIIRIATFSVNKLHPRKAMGEADGSTACEP